MFEVPHEIPTEIPTEIPPSFLWLPVKHKSAPLLLPMSVWVVDLGFMVHVGCGKKSMDP